MNTATVSGYGPMASKLKLNGYPTKYELWEIKFLSFLRLQKLLSVIESNDTIDAGYERMNANVITLLAQFQDDTIPFPGGFLTNQI